ncbi:hypothetical protein [Halococcus saccharolyticus]|uniref:Uncharacterized protein n=1 Tax=Halococcus saccharolyticus DSM 5350 TaxID=1227455 RepID=M0MFY9_9EURY|nr:hypothetical protein [Halococcus saccharolyticus]EMA44278.1 hypothetical protein C449_12148 [Halococcus saccharolyticus DSM 5350]
MSDNNPPAALHGTQVQTASDTTELMAALRTMAFGTGGAGVGSSKGVDGHAPLCQSCGVKRRVEATTRVVMSDRPLEAYYVCSAHRTAALAVIGSLGVGTQTDGGARS